METAETQAQRLEQVYDQVRMVFHQREGVTVAPSEQEWSAMQILGHLVEMIPYWLHHCHHLIAATGEPPQFGRTLDAPERLAGVEQGASGNLDGLLQLLYDEVQSATQIIRQMSSVERGKRGVHSRRGEMTVADVIELLIVAHAEEHLAQLELVLQK